MSDTTTNQFVGRGTAADMAAFTPNPPTPANAPPLNGYTFFNTTDGLLYAWDGAAWVTVGSGTTPDRALTFGFSGSSLAAAQYVDAYVPYSCTITAATVMGDVVGAVVFDVLTSGSFATAPTTSIVASAPPTLSADDGSQDTTLTGWTTSVSAGTRMRAKVTSTSGLAWATLTLTVTV